MTSKGVVALLGDSIIDNKVYVGKNEVPRYFGGLGVAFMSTSKGVMTGQQARREGLGGELLFYIW